MAIRKEHTFAPGDRYYYDFNVCSYGKGWAQVDTKQDASYYGNWCNPHMLRLLSYAEGDVTVTYCDTEEEFVQAMRELHKWNADNGYWLGIDPGFSYTLLKNKFTAMGLQDLLHPEAVGEGTSSA